MFSENGHGKVRWFGKWDDKTRHIYRSREAFAVLERAARECVEQDMRHDQELIAALAYLSNITTKRELCVRFWRCLNHSPGLRQHAVTAVMRSIERALPRKDQDV
jgi:hypothetical protein